MQVRSMQLEFDHEESLSTEVTRVGEDWKCDLPICFDERYFGTVAKRFSRHPSPHSSPAQPAPSSPAFVSLYCKAA